MTDKKNRSEDMRTVLLEMCEKARMAALKISAMEPHDKNACLLAMAAELENSSDEIIEANSKDLKLGMEKGLSAAMLDRLKLDHNRIKAMADGVRDIVGLEDPVGKRLSVCIRPNGLRIEKVSVPIGVICIVYEARPNVTVDAAALCFKAGNAVILRGGSEAIHSNIALANCMKRAGLESGLPEGAVQLVPWTDRDAVSLLLKMNQYIDLVIPRGGEGLIRAVVEQSTIPVIKHYKGVCHLYVDSECDFNMALSIIENAKCQRPGVCNAVEKLLLHDSVAGEFAPKVARLLLGRGVELIGDSRFCAMVPEARPATEADWSEEYCDLKLTVGVVDSLEKAVEHINTYGSRHSDGIITTNSASAEYFMRMVDSSTVYHNASTRFTDGGEFGMGAEIGISTDKLHARGPMGLPELTIYKYMVYGSGQVRG